MISVIVVTLGKRNEALKHLRRALDKQTFNDFETILVLPKGENPANWNIPIVIQSGVGICNARNCGVKASRGEIIAFTDDDAEPYPDWLEQIARAFTEHPDLAYLGGEFELQPNCVWHRWIDARYHMRDVHSGHCHGNNMAYRRTVFEKHRFDENILFGRDEVELQDRLKADKIKGRTFNHILIQHNHRSNFLSFSQMRWRYAQGHTYTIEEKRGESLFHWHDLIIMSFFSSLFFTVVTCKLWLAIFPLFFLMLLFLHRRKPNTPFNLWIIDVYVSILWCFSKMYYSFKYHLKRWGWLR